MTMSVGRKRRVERTELGATKLIAARPTRNSVSLQVAGVGGGTRQLAGNRTVRQNASSPSALC